MQDTGIVRRVDDLGRIVIPMEIRRDIGIHVKDPMQIFVEGERIILQKHVDSCALCGTTEGELKTALIRGDERKVCPDCIKSVVQAR